MPKGDTPESERAARASPRHAPERRNTPQTQKCAQNAETAPQTQKRARTAPNGVKAAYGSVVGA
ncbi:MAG: hypothetical protein NC433_02145 [Clostridiales bacterium]|nr:hypothetical protein [Clostridiales bacterium]